MLIFDECLVNINGHADTADTVEVVSFDGHATEQGARPVNGDVIPLLECVDETFGMVITNIFDAKISNQ